VGVDNDPEALRNARENVTRNGAGEGVELVDGDLGVLSLPGGDILLANLTGAVLLRYVQMLIGLAKPGATAILSGFAPEDRPAIAAAWTGWSLRDRRVDGDWAALAICRGM
jgi:ribosomal protein L11 methylase PrmA